MASLIEDLLFKEECYKIIGLSMKVHSKLGKGFKEVVYKDALEIEFINNQIPYEREKFFTIPYEDVILRHYFIADFSVYDSIIIEVKAASMIHPDNFRQTLNYLKASHIKLGILINFGENKLKFQRIVCSY
ncbi:MAG: GxxExxY protein [Bacteroidota bacterium]|nr:GxxExxY protein [Bacteroidota bacterium]